MSASVQPWHFNWASFKKKKKRKKRKKLPTQNDNGAKRFRNENTQVDGVHVPIISIESSDDDEKTSEIITIEDSHAVLHPKSVQESKDQILTDFIEIDSTADFPDLTDIILNIEDNAVDKDIPDNIHDIEDDIIEKDIMEEVPDVKVPRRINELNPFPKSWTQDMIKYYTEPCEKNRNFDYKEVLKGIKSAPSDWWINKTDADVESRKKKRSYIRCRKCLKSGHRERECESLVVCFICGEYGHYDQECHNTICYTCGRRLRHLEIACPDCCEIINSRIPCSLCFQEGHDEYICPSKWRKYADEHVKKSSDVQLNQRRYCYNCSAKGHFGFECPLPPYSEYQSDNPLLSAFPVNTETPASVARWENVDDWTASKNTSGYSDRQIESHPLLQPDKFEELIEEVTNVEGDKRKYRRKRMAWRSKINKQKKRKQG